MKLRVATVLLWLFAAGCWTAFGFAIDSNPRLDSGWQSPVGVFGAMFGLLSVVGAGACMMEWREQAGTRRESKQFEREQATAKLHADALEYGLPWPGVIDSPTERIYQEISGRSEEDGWLQRG